MEKGIKKKREREGKHKNDLYFNPFYKLNKTNQGKLLNFNYSAIINNN